MIRKTILFAALLISLSFADSWGQDWKSILNGIAKTAIGDNATSEYSIIGTWNYKGASSQFDSDNLLAQAGGAAATSKINTEIAKIYAKIGFDSAQFTFNEDKTYSIRIGKITSTGTYTFDSANKNITLKTKMGITINAKVVTLGSSMSFLFNADKLLDALKSLTGLASKINTNTTYISSILSLLENYDGLKVGFELTKQ